MVPFARVLVSSPRFMDAVTGVEVTATGSGVQPDRAIAATRPRAILFKVFLIVFLVAGTFSMFLRFVCSQGLWGALPLGG